MKRKCGDCKNFVVMDILCHDETFCLKKKRGDGGLLDVGEYTDASDCELFEKNTTGTIQRFC